MNRKKSCKGFTLVELIVVLVILAILAALLIPAFTGWIDKAKKAVIMEEGSGVMKAAQAAYIEWYGMQPADSTQTTYSYKGLNSAYNNCIAYTNWALMTTNWNRTNLNSNQKGSIYVGKRISAYFSEYSAYQGTDIYNSKSVSNVKGMFAKLSNMNSYALFIVLDMKSASVVECDYARNGMFFMFRDGTVKVISKNDSDATTYGFCYKQETGGAKIESYDVHKW